MTLLVDAVHLVRVHPVVLHGVHLDVELALTDSRLPLDAAQLRHAQEQVGACVVYVRRERAHLDQKARDSDGWEYEPDAASGNRTEAR